MQVERGVDGLAPAGTIAALPDVGPAAPGQLATPTRAGVVFNWIPDRFLYLADLLRNALVRLQLQDDLEVVRVAGIRRFELPELAQPVDLAPVVQEVANPTFSSNTTLAGGADLYVANRGDGTIQRLRQDGRVIAIAELEVPGLGRVGPGRLNGIAVSPDARTLWVTLSGELPAFPGHDGAVVELPAPGAMAARASRQGSACLGVASASSAAAWPCFSWRLP